MRALTMGVVGMLMLAANAAYAVDVTFTSDASIVDGNDFRFVSIYDTPPNQTTVNMIGGSAQSVYAYDSSLFSIYDGEISWGLMARNSSTFDIYGGIISCESLSVADLATLNIYGGSFFSGNAPYFSELSTVNVYGYGFEYDDWSLTGFLQDGSCFTFGELSANAYEHINLIPEPGTFLFFALGALFLKRRL